MNVQPDTLITAFGSFPGVPENPTELLLERIKNDKSQDATRHKTLPVSFDRVFQALEPMVVKYCPSKLLHLGVASEATQFRIETQAFNHIASRVPDVDGRKPQNARIDRRLPQAHHLTGSPHAERILSHLHEASCPAKLSGDTGRYVCNALFYSSLAAFGGKLEVNFVHIPPVGAIFESGEVTHQWSLESLARGLQVVLDFL